MAIQKAVLQAQEAMNSGITINNGGGGAGSSAMVSEQHSASLHGAEGIAKVSSSQEPTMGGSGAAGGGGGLGEGGKVGLAALQLAQKTHSSLHTGSGDSPITGRNSGAGAAPAAPMDPLKQVGGWQRNLLAVVFLWLGNRACKGGVVRTPLLQNARHNHHLEPGAPYLHGHSTLLKNGHPHADAARAPAGPGARGRHQGGRRQAGAHQRAGPRGVG